MIPMHGTLVTLEKSTVLYGCGTRETLKDEWTSGRIVDWFTQFPALQGHILYSHYLVELCNGTKVFMQVSHPTRRLFQSAPTIGLQS